VWRFRGHADGAIPYAGLTFDDAGALYGATRAGGGDTSLCGEGCGVVFKLTPSGSKYTERVVYRFHGGSDGSDPAAAVVISDKTIYGATYGGGGSPCYCGTIFALTPAKSGYAEKVLYSFLGGQKDGNGPVGLMRSARGALFGATAHGGAACEGSQGGCGTVFRLSPAASRYSETILHSFGSAGDGRDPASGVIEDAGGNLYGTTMTGQGETVDGVVYELVPSGVRYRERILHVFKGGYNDGLAPIGGLLEQKGILYGTTTNGGARDSSGAGTVFSVVP
jgi:uncharacterized repeat protein (TIGR03803 family)